MDDTRDLILSMDSFAKTLNNLTFTDYYLRLSLLAKSVFEWCNLPNNISEKWIESYLYSYGDCVFFKDNTLGLMVAKVNQSGMVNAYDEPTRVVPVATNYTYEGEDLINGENCVVIYNNDLRLPTARTLQLYAYRLAEIQRTSDVNIHAQKTPCLLTGNDKSILSLKQIYKKWEGNEPVIYYDKNGFEQPISVLKTEAPVVFDKLRLEKNQIWNEACTFLGINNANQDKRERLVADEVEANNEQVQLSAHVFLKNREEACKRINEMFGQNISVKARQFEEIQKKAGEESERTIHNSTV